MIFNTFTPKTGGAPPYFLWLTIQVVTPRRWRGVGDQHSTERTPTHVAKQGGGGRCKCREERPPVTARAPRAVRGARGWWVVCGDEPKLDLERVALLDIHRHVEFLDVRIVWLPGSLVGEFELCGACAGCCEFEGELAWRAQLACVGFE